MKAKGIKNLLIDFGGVLINLDRQRCIENFRKLGLQNVDELLNVYHQQGIFYAAGKGIEHFCGIPGQHSGDGVKVVDRSAD